MKKNKLLLVHSLCCVLVTWNLKGFHPKNFTVIDQLVDWEQTKLLLKVCKERMDKGRKGRRLDKSNKWIEKKSSRGERQKQSNSRDAISHDAVPT